MKSPIEVIAEFFWPGYLDDSVRQASNRLLDAFAAEGMCVRPIVDDATRQEVRLLKISVAARKASHLTAKRFAISDRFDHVDMYRLERMAELLADAYLGRTD